MAKRPPRHKVNHKQRADAIAALHRVVKNPDAAEYVKAKAAAALISAAKIDDDGEPDRDPDAPGTVVFVPRKDQLPGQREDETRLEFTDRRKAWVEGRRAVYCESLGEDYDPARPLPCWPWRRRARTPNWKTRPIAGLTKPRRPRSSASGAILGRSSSKSLARRKTRPS